MRWRDTGREGGRDGEGGLGREGGGSQGAQ